MLEHMFALRARRATVGTGVLAGATTFMVMAYIIFVNPTILSFSGMPDLAGQGPGFAPTLAATCLVAGVMTALMGLVTNYPFAMASGMGLNAVVAFQLVVGLKLPWPTAMGVITLEGIIITLLVLTGFRTAVVDAIPLALKRAIGVGGEGGWLDAHGQLPRLNRVLLVDSLGAVFGGIAAASSATTYIESAAGVAVGGRTGLTSLVTAGGFFLALLLSSLAAIVPPQATAGARIVVGYLMCGIMREIPFGDFEEGFPTLATIVARPLTYSITNGIGAGMLTYAFIKIVRGKTHELSPTLLIVALAFLVYFAEPWLVRVLAF
jgi:adenine/guanine/hypoxanthine permease